MARFAIEYSETYSRVYFVEADNFHNGVNKLQAAIMEGDVESPKQCSDSDYVDLTGSQDDETLKDDRILDIV